MTAKEPWPPTCPPVSDFTCPLPDWSGFREGLALGAQARGRGTSGSSETQPPAGPQEQNC